MANLKLATTMVRFAQREQTEALRLHTVGRANRAYLEPAAAGGVNLYFRGLYYGVDDYLPDSVNGSRSISPSVTAGEFVCRQMLRDYGYQENEWPALARQFLVKHRTCKPDRSRSAR